jgi:hypothetical protein
MNTHLRFALIPLALVLAATPALAHKQKGARNTLQNHTSVSNAEQLPPVFRKGKGARSHDQGGIILQHNTRAGGSTGNGGIILQHNASVGGSTGNGGIILQNNNRTNAVQNRGGIILQNQNRGGIILQNQNRGGIILQHGQKAATGSSG